RKESINIVHKNAGFLDVFARTNIINQIGVLVSVFPGIREEPKKRGDQRSPRGLVPRENL
ncbi:hypothetical protein ACWA3C_28085, partial [Pseudomonas chlororaphis]